MPRGGARVNSGPAASPKSLRRSADEWVTLPEDGREGPAPEWPLVDPSDRELELWAAEWRRPQAVMWERNQLQMQVALYVRYLAIVEQPGGRNVELRKTVNQMQNDLGLSLGGMKLRQWRIGTSEDAEVTPIERSESSRSRLKVVNGGAE